LLVQWVGVLGIEIHQKGYLCVFHWFFGGPLFTRCKFPRSVHACSQ
jgi:hypothetical protein